jgi:hypothetical protein
MLASIKHILPLTTLRRERLLPIPGKVVVRKGQKVSATDTIAEAYLSPSHMLFDIARGLRVPAERAEKLIQVEVGARIAEGDIIAGPVGLTRRVIRAPKDGRVVLIGEGQVLLELRGRPFELKAGIPGIIRELVPERGAVIETTGALIQGVWGNGGVDFGLMIVKAKDPTELLTADQLDVSLRGSVILAGYVKDADVLKTAGELPLRGLILSSMDPVLIPLAIKVSVPIILLEGFGKRPVDGATFQLLTTNERREVALNADVWDRHRGTRPEVVIPLPASGEPPLPTDFNVFSSGQKVKITRAPFEGKIGTIDDLVGIVELPSGIRTQAAEVRLEDGNSTVLPLANLEVLE